jgi:dTDP-4-dehydrorhamnose reductase
MLEMAKERLLITGANGLLGNKAVELASRDYEVMPLHHAKP